MRYMPSLAQGALERLVGYFWPSNIRELENLVERSLILSRGEPLAFNDLQAPEKAKLRIEHGVGTEIHPDLQMGDSLAMDTVMSEHIRQVLDMTGGRVGGEQGAALLLNINPSTLRKRMRQLGIPFGRKARKGYKN